MDAGERLSSCCNTSREANVAVRMRHPDTTFMLLYHVRNTDEEQVMEWTAGDRNGGAARGLPHHERASEHRRAALERRPSALAMFPEVRPRIWKARESRSPWSRDSSPIGSCCRAHQLMASIVTPTG